jgi:large subunit ribosomal protein L6
MSRIGKQQLTIPAGVEVTFDAHAVRVKGPKGELSRAFAMKSFSRMKTASSQAEPRRNDKFSRSLWGTYMSHVQNMIAGVVTPFEKKLLVEGVGIKWEVKGTDLVMNLGFSHQVIMKIPAGTYGNCRKKRTYYSGNDKEEVGLFANKVRQAKPPEPYKGKGIRYANEVIRRKQGKKSA